MVEGPEEYIEVQAVKKLVQDGLYTNLTMYLPLEECDRATCELSLSEGVHEIGFTSPYRGTSVTAQGRRCTVSGLEPMREYEFQYALWCGSNVILAYETVVVEKRGYWFSKVLSQRSSF